RRCTPLVLVRRAQERRSTARFESYFPLPLTHPLAAGGVSRSAERACRCYDAPVGWHPLHHEVGDAGEHLFGIGAVDGDCEVMIGVSADAGTDRRYPFDDRVVDAAQEVLPDRVILEVTVDDR